MTSGYFLGFHFGLGGTGLWLGQSVGVTIAAILFLARFRYQMIRQEKLIKP